MYIYLYEYEYFNNYEHITNDKIYFSNQYQY